MTCAGKVPAAIRRYISEHERPVISSTAWRLIKRRMGWVLLVVLAIVCASLGVIGNDGCTVKVRVGVTAMGDIVSSHTVTH